MTLRLLQHRADDGARSVIADGGAVLILPSGTDHAEDREYAALYDRFATLIDEGRSDMDSAPLRLVADAFLRGAHISVEDFDD